MILSIFDNAILKLGDSGDLEILHDGGSSIIRELGSGPDGTGQIFIQSDEIVNITKVGGQNRSAEFDVDDKVALYFDGSRKFET